MKKRLLAIATVAVVLVVLGLAAGIVRPQYHYCFDSGSIWVFSEPTLFAPHGYASDGVTLRRGLAWVWNGMAGVQLTFDVPKSADPLGWKPPRETVLAKLKELEAQHSVFVAGYDRETYATN